MKEFFDATIRIERMMENGLTKTVTERYILESYTFTDAEKRLMEEIKMYGEFKIRAIKIVEYMEIVCTEDETADKFFNVKISLIVPDEESGKEKKSTVNLLVQASDVSNALARVKENMKDSIVDYEIKNIADTPIMDVFYHKL